MESLRDKQFDMGLDQANSEADLGYIKALAQQGQALYSLCNASGGILQELSYYSRYLQVILEQVSKRTEMTHSYRKLSESRNSAAVFWN